MPLDPTISLHAGEGGPPSLTANPLALATGLTGLANVQQEMQARGLAMQQQQNAINQWQQEFAGRQRLGQIMAAAPDTEQGLAAAAQDPTIARYPGLLNEYRTLQSTLADVAVKKAQVGEVGARTTEAQTGAMRNMADVGLIGAHTTQTQADVGQSFLTGLNRVATGAANDPTQLPLLTKQYLATQPPELQARMRPMVDSYVQSLLPAPGLTGDAAVADYRKNLAARLMGAGVDTGPLIGSTSIGTAGGLPIQQRAAPQLPLPGGTAAGGLAPAAGSAGLASVPQASAATAPIPTAGDGRPLYDPAQLTAAPTPSTPAALQQQQLAATDLTKAFTGPELDAFRSAQVAQGQLRDVSASIDQLAKTGGMLRPGSGGAARLALANGLNAASEALGGKPLVDPQAVAAGELLQKDTFRLGTNLLTSLYGGQHEAAQTIESAVSAVPSINNSVLGGKLLADNLLAGTQRQIDERAFKQAWQANPANEGNLNGAVEAFNAQHPATEYVNRVLDQFGMDKQGFKNAAAVRDAFANGYLTKTQALEVLKQKYPNGVPAAAAPGSGP